MTNEETHMWTVSLQAEPVDFAASWVTGGEGLHAALVVGRVKRLTERGLAVLSLATMVMGSLAAETS